LRTPCGEKKARFSIFKRISAFYETRPLCVAAALFGAGAFLGANNAFSGWFLGAAVFSLIFILLKKPYLAAFCAVFFLGLALASHAASPSLPVQGDYAIEGIVNGDIKFDAETGQVKGMLESVRLNGEKEKHNGYWSFYLDEGEKPPELKDGDLVCFTGSLYHPQGQVNPYGFDFKKYLNQNNMAYGLYGRDGLTIKGDVGTGIFHLAYKLREYLAVRIQSAMGDSAPLAIAMILGDRRAIPEEDNKAFSDLGIAHILSISGLHMTYLVGMMMLFFRAIKLKHGRQMPVMAVFLCFYSILTGLSGPVMRSAVVAICMLGAKRARRHYDALTALAFSFMLILLFAPLEIEKAGFVMTYTAVLGILLLYRPILRLFRKLPKWLRESLAVSIAAQMGIMLPVMVFYRQVQLFSPIVNLAAVPYTGLLTVLYFLTTIFPFLGGVASLASDFFMLCVRKMAALPFLTAQTISPPWYLLVIWFLFLWILSDYSALKKRAKGIGVFALVTAFAVGCFAFSITPTRYTLFSNGQADGAIVEKGNYTMVIDAGDHGGDMASYLRARNRKVDALVLTHLHSDHVMGLKKFIDNEVQVKAVYVPKGYEGYEWDEGCLAVIESLNLPLETLEKGNSLPYADVLWPDGEHLPKNSDGNDISLGLLLDLEGVRIATYGDLTDRYDAYAAVKADVLKVSHHGSRNGNSAAFIETVSPGIALISCRDNALLPSPVTLKKLEGIPVYRTDIDGAITILPKESGFVVETFLP